ncbi:hypothetical protein ACFLXA_06745, partial [Chloroflexota bacterium]
MKKLFGIVLAVILTIALTVPMTSTVMAAYTYDQPSDGDYLTATTLIDLSGISDTTTLTSVSDGTLTVDFDQTMTKTQVPGGWATWGAPPATEGATPHILHQLASDTLTMDLSWPCYIFGFELEPNNMWDIDFDLEYILMSGPTTVATGTSTINGGGGALLMALNAEGEFFDRVVINADPVDDAGGFAIAQIRYAAAVDLAIAKSGPGQVIAGELFSYDITVMNYGPATASNVVVTDLLPGTVTYVTSGIPDTGIPGIPQFELGDMAAGEIRSFTMVVKVNPDLVAGPTAITNYIGVIADQPDYNYANNEDSATTIVLEEADLKITKDIKPDGTVQAGEEAVCTIFIDNLGPSTARNVELIDEFLSNGTFLRGDITVTSTPLWSTMITTVNPQELGGQVTILWDYLAAGERITVKIPFTAAETQTINNHATVSSDNDPNLGNNQDHDSVAVGDTADLEIIKTAASDVTAGNSLTYTLEVFNRGPSTATDVVVEDWLPAGVVINSISAPAWVGITYGVPGDPSQPTTFNLGNMAPVPDPINPVVLTINVTVDPQTADGTLLQNNADVSSDEYDPMTHNNVASTVTTVDTEADLSITKWANLGGGDITAGAEFTYTVTVTNNGPSTARDVLMFDYLSPYVTLVDVSIPGGGTWDEFAINNLRCGLNDIDPGDSVVVFITVMVDPSVPAGATIHNSATVMSSTEDLTPGNNEATDDTQVITEVDMAIEKYGDPDPVIAGEKLIYHITVTNNGPSDASNVRVWDTLPLWVSFDTATVPSAPDGPGTRIYYLGPIAAGESKTFRIEVEVNSNAVVGFVDGERTILNTAHVEAEQPESNWDDNTIVTPTIVNDEADLKIIKDIKPDGTVLA